MLHFYRTHSLHFYAELFLLRPVCEGPFYLLSVNPNVNLLVVERNKTLDVQTIVRGRAIPPHNVLDRSARVGYTDRIVRRDSLSEEYESFE